MFYFCTRAADVSAEKCYNREIWLIIILYRGRCLGILAFILWWWWTCTHIPTLYIYIVWQVTVYINECCIQTALHQSVDPWDVLLLLLFILFCVLETFINGYTTFYWHNFSFKFLFMTVRVLFVNINVQYV